MHPPPPHTHTHIHTLPARGTRALLLPPPPNPRIIPHTRTHTHTRTHLHTPITHTHTSKHTHSLPLTHSPANMQAIALRTREFVSRIAAIVAATMGMGPEVVMATGLLSRRRTASTRAMLWASLTMEAPTNATAWVGSRMIARKSARPSTAAAATYVPSPLPPLFFALPYFTGPSISFSTLFPPDLSSSPFLSSPLLCFEI